MSPHKGYMNIAIAAMLFAAAFAGVALIADEDVAAEGSSGPVAGAEESEFTVTYAYGGSSIVKKMDEGNKVTFANALSFSAPAGYAFETSKVTEESSSVEKMIWKDASSGAKYVEGQTYSFSANIVVEPIVKIAEGYATITLTDGASAETFLVEKNKESAFVLDPTNAELVSYLASIGLKITEVKESPDASVSYYKIEINKDGFNFEGFSKSASATGLFKVSELVGANKEDTVYTAKFTPVYDVTFVVDGIKTFECASDKFIQPIDPVKANYTFMGWAVDGKIVSEVKAGVITIPADYKFEADTAFTAVFEPVQLTLTLVVGEFQTTQPALYGQKITAPGLPDGYSHWATMAVVDEKEVYTEFDFSQAIVENMTLYAQKAEKVYTISFISEGAVIGGPYDVSKPYTIPADPVVEGKKFVGWFIGDYKVADIKAYVAEHPDEDIVLTASFTQADAPAGPGFFETNEGKCVAVIIGVALLAFIYAVYTNMFGMKDFLTSFKIQRVKKE